MRIVWMDYLRAFCAFTVVVMHVAVPYYTAFGKIDNAVWWLGNIQSTVFRFALPMFVMISGALLLGRDINVIEFYKKKAIRLTLPFFFWTLFYLVFSGITGNDIFLTIWTGMKFDVLIKGTAYYHLWFFSMFVFLMLFYPFINSYVIGKKPSPKELILLMLVSSLCFVVNQISLVTFAARHLEVEWHKTFPWYIVYFVFGYILMQYGSLVRIGTRSLAASCVVIMVVGCLANALMANNYGIVGDGQFLTNSGIFVLIFTGLLFLLCARNAGFFKESRLVSSVADASFGIFLVHPFFLYFMRKIPGYYENGFFYMPVSSLVVFGVSFLSVAWMRKLKVFRYVS